MSNYPYTISGRVNAILEVLLEREMERGCVLCGKAAAAFTTAGLCSDCEDDANMTDEEMTAHPIH